MNRRAEILHELVAYRPPTEQLHAELWTFGWDWLDDEPLLIITREHLLSIIDRYLAGEISSAQLQQWAENLECREDVDFEETNKDIIDSVFFRLALPEINGVLTPESVQGMKAEIQNANQTIQSTPLRGATDG